MSPLKRGLGRAGRFKRGLDGFTWVDRGIRRGFACIFTRAEFWRPGLENGKLCWWRLSGIKK